MITLPVKLQIKLQIIADKFGPEITCKHLHFRSLHQTFQILSPQKVAGNVNGSSRSTFFPPYSKPIRMIHRLALTMLLSATALVTLAAENQVIHLWPNGAPGPEPKLEAERDLTKDTENKVAGQRLIRLGNVTDPTITLYPAPKDKAHGGAVLVCPGGGYHI